ncbi:MAG: exodeoxyribonuclease VII small subunit [Schwartzia sp.]|nr:exodeoxyribonuclease VII small subunit [Schwartzia sp. (in: firmicutes)]
MATKREGSFEESLAELESIVSKMEEGEPELSELMKHYSRGVTLSQKCLKALERAEQTMDLMVREDAAGGVEEAALEIEGDQ